jgi:uncharacterized protein YcbK (DUF882 family)
MRLTQHFALSELRCACGCAMQPEILDRLRSLAVSLEIIRAEINRPLMVISGHRCAERNARVGGAPASRHLMGDAVDLQARGMTGADLRRVAESLIAARKIPDGGLGTYADRPLTLHYDQRGVKARWHHEQRAR